MLSSVKVHTFRRDCVRYDSESGLLRMSQHLGDAGSMPHIALSKIHSLTGNKNMIMITILILEKRCALYFYL